MKKVVVKISTTFTYDVKNEDDFDLDEMYYDYEEKAIGDLCDLVRDEYFNDLDIEVIEEDFDESEYED